MFIVLALRLPFVVTVCALLILIVYLLFGGILTKMTAADYDNQIIRWLKAAPKQTLTYTEIFRSANRPSSEEHYIHASIEWLLREGFIGKGHNEGELVYIKDK